MMEGWKRVKIGDLGKIVTGNTPPKKDPTNYGSDYPFIKPTDMDIDRRYVTSWDENYSEKAFKRYKNSYIPPKATGVVTIGTVGEKIFQADRWCFTNQSVNVVIANEDYNENFIYYALKVNLPKVLGANPGTASGRHHVSKSNFCAIKIDVPKSKETQRKIASILSAYDDLIENNLKRIKLLEEQVQQTYEEWFVRFKFPGYEDVALDEESGLPVGWEKVKLDELVKLQQGFALNKKSNHHISEMKTNYPLLKIGDLLKGTVSLWVKETIPKQFLVEKNEIIYSRTGQVGLAFIGRKGVIYNNCFRVTANEKLDSMMLYYFLTSDSIIEKAKSLATGSAQPDLNHGAFKSIEINLPLKEIQNNFSTIAHQNQQLKENLQNQNQRLKEARDILLPRLMSGLVDVDSLEVKALKQTV
ncbi:hypothetical protein DS884_11070 [Tenacibaculum sp. E3R01]|uniref:restriction endonuclease subunit S n=1 Tax=Tenacibaculum sp. E3R01 TaxID=2267227 RepID=UPI000DE93DF5|nr:restriction endonuclease subunit S [Tenacibaculum sp. E3R01]RBW57587.1 hypothetical protein DS884_11070 [Tenacibaculum sp. E3R01]